MMIQHISLPSSRKGTFAIDLTVKGSIGFLLFLRTRLRYLEGFTLEDWVFVYQLNSSLRHLIYSFTLDYKFKVIGIGLPLVIIVSSP